MSSINCVDYDPSKYVPLPETFLEEIDQLPRVNEEEAKAGDRCKISSPRFVSFLEHFFDETEQPPRVNEEEAKVGGTSHGRKRNLPACRGEESHGFRRSLHASSEDHPCWCKLILATLWTLGLLLAVLVAPRGWSVYALAGMYFLLAVPAAFLVPIGMRLMKFPFFPVPFSAWFITPSFYGWILLPLALLCGGIGMLLSLSSASRLRVFACVPAPSLVIIFLCMAPL